MQHGGRRASVTSRHLGPLLLLGALTVVAACPRGAMATMRMVTLGAAPQTWSAAAPEIGEPGTEVRFAVATVLRRRPLGPPPSEPPLPETNGTPPPVASGLAAIFAVWWLALPGWAFGASLSALVGRERGPPLPIPG